MSALSPNGFGNSQVAHLAFKIKHKSSVKSSIKKMPNTLLILMMISSLMINRITQLTAELFKNKLIIKKNKQRNSIKTLTKFIKLK